MLIEKMFPHYDEEVMADRLSGTARSTGSSRRRHRHRDRDRVPPWIHLRPVDEHLVERHTPADIAGRDHEPMMGIKGDFRISGGKIDVNDESYPLHADSF